MLSHLNGETRLHLIIGDPVGQTKSPSGLTGEFARRGVNAVCIPFHVAAADFHDVISAATRIRNIDGIVITMPHKFAALVACRDATARARFLGAVNLMRRLPGGGWHGDMTDGIATVAALRRAGFAPAGRSALVVGAGGAGSAVALELVEARVRALAVADTDTTRRDDLVARFAAAAPGVARAAMADPTGYDLVVNATPSGMRPDDPLPVDPALLAAGAFVTDLITQPVITPLLEAARRRGCAIVTGEDMFAVQAPIMADIVLALPDPTGG